MDINAPDTSPEAILSYIRTCKNLESDLEVFLYACRINGIVEAHDEYRIFNLNGRKFLPACVRAEYLALSLYTTG